MEHIVLEQHPELDRPTIVMAFRGWNDAGDAASGAAEYLREKFDARRFAYMDPEEFYDFQVVRPVVELVDGTTRHIVWPQNAFWHACVGEHDVVLFIGTEPNMRWKTFTHEVIALGRELGARRLVTLGAFLADVAHTRDVPIVGTAGSPEEAESLALAPSRYQGPTGIVGVMQDIANRTGLPSVSFWAAVPHYVSSGENPKAAMALVRRLASFIEAEIDVEDLRPAAQAWEDAVSEQIGRNEALVEYVRGLEEANDQTDFTPSSGSLADEVERFLEQRDGESTE